VIFRLLARLIAPPHEKPTVRVTTVSDPREKERARRLLADIDAEVRTMERRQ
jgi:hypothetical protein